MKKLYLLFLLTPFLIIGQQHGPNCTHDHVRGEMLENHNSNDFHPNLAENRVSSTIPYSNSFENGFGDDFSKWMSDVLGVPFKVEDVPYEKLSYDESNKLKKTGNLIDNIRTMCRRDIEQLYPELAASFQEGTKTNA